MDKNKATEEIKAAYIAGQREDGKVSIKYFEKHLEPKITKYNMQTYKAAFSQ